MIARLVPFLFFLSLCFANYAQEIERNHSINHAFIENKGQWNDQILFKSKFDGGNLWIQQKKMVFHLQDFSATQALHANFKEFDEAPVNRQTVVHLNFEGANEVTDIEKSEETPNYYNYFLGDDPNKWASEVRGYGEAVLHDLYDGIDLKLIEELEQLKYEFHVKPGIDPNQIILEYSGQDKILIDKKGNLVVHTELGDIIEQKPYAYQIVNGNVREIDCQYILENDKVTFDLGVYNPNAVLVIDPVLIFATYSGSVSDNFGMTATYGYDGTAYSGGTVFGNAYPMPSVNAFDISGSFTVPTNPNYGITDVFISKYSPDGAAMIWSTYLGGGDSFQGSETVQSLICDASNNLYIYGTTSSTDFPIQGGFQSVFGGGVPGADFLYNGVYFGTAGTDIYIAKISDDGQNLMNSTFIGGSGNDGVNYRTSVVYNNVAAYDSLTPNYGDQFRGEIMIDSIGNCIVASCTRSTDFPLESPFQATNAGNQDGVIFKLNSDLSALQWSSYFGGSNNDACYSVKLDLNYNLVFSGGTSSNNLTNTAAGWQPVYGGGKTDGFVMKLSSNGTTITNGSYIGTSNSDQAYFVEVDRVDNIYVLGQSAGGNFPVINSVFVNPGSSQFVLKLEPTLVIPISSTVFGNGSPNINISPSAFLVDICGNIYISGWGANILQSSPLSGMPVTNDAYQGSPPNGFDFYLLVIERDFTDTLYGTYMGGSSAQEHVDGGTSRFDKNGVVYQSVCGGCGGFSDFPTTSGAWSNNNLNTNCNNVVFKFDFQLIPTAEFTVDNNYGCKPFTVTFENFSTSSDSYLWDFGNGDTTSIIFEPTIVFDSVGVFQVFLYATDSICLITDSAEITITVYDSLELSVSSDVSICVPIPIDLTAFTNGTGVEYIWSSSLAFSDTLNSNILDSVFNVTPPGAITYYVNAYNDGCSLIDSVSVNVSSSNLIITANDSICIGDETIITANSTNPLITFTNFIWSPDSVIISPSNTNSITVNPSVSQYVFVTATSNTGCVATDSIQIYVGNIPLSAIDATASEYTIPQGAEVTLFGSPSGYNYLWSPSNFVVNANSLSTETTGLEESTLFTFFVTDGICTKSDTVLIKTYEFQCDDGYLFVPNAFTPNGDGENDVLFVRGPAIKKMVFRIFDRWGELVFESFERPFGWDGKYKGKMMNPDVYDYYLKVTCIDEVESIIKGNFTLIR